MAPRPDPARADIAMELKSQVGRADLVIPLLSAAFVASERCLPPWNRRKRGRRSIWRSSSGGTAAI